MALNPPISGVINDKEFIVISVNTEFELAETECTQLVPPALPASFASVQEFDFVLDLIDQVQSIPDLPNMFWIGFIREEDEFGVDAAAFFFIDGTPSVFDQNGERPWASGEPNNFEGDQRCTNIDRGNGNNVENRLIDQKCAGREELTQGGIVCSRNVETVAPTSNPTSSPTEGPTKSPTDSPSENPTSSPTANPTELPTLSPTGFPTLNPSLSPTLRPSIAIEIELVDVNEQDTLVIVLFVAVGVLVAAFLFQAGRKLVKIGRREAFHSFIYNLQDKQREHTQEADNLGHRKAEYIQETYSLEPTSLLQTFESNN